MTAAEGAAAGSSPAAMVMMPARSWSDIPLNIICNVLRRLTVRDFVRCGAVCASWRPATLQCRPMLEPPWVIPFRYGGTRGVVCPPERRLRRVPSMPWDMMLCFQYLGSSNGWLGLQRMESIHILHVLSGAILRLPDLATIPGVKVIPDHDGTGRWWGLTFPLQGRGRGNIGSGRYPLKPNGSPFFDGIFVVSPPVGDDNCDQLIVFALCSHMWGLLFARPGEISWSFVNMPAPVGNFIVDLTGHRGSVYAVDRSGRVAAWDYLCGGAANAASLASTGPQFTRIVISSGPPPSAIPVQRYLVEEVNGSLLQVEKEVEVNAEGLYKTVVVRIFRLEQSGSGESERRVWWRRLQHLGHGGMAVFVGRGFSAAFTCYDFPWLWRNCIYFTDGVYNLRTREIQTLPFHYRWFQGDWLIPTLR